MERYNEFGENIYAKYVIIVPTEFDKKELMDALEHLHYSDCDTDFNTVCKLVHEYLEGEDRDNRPNNIVVSKELYEKHKTN